MSYSLRRSSVGMPKILMYIVKQGGGERACQAVYRNQLHVLLMWAINRMQLGQLLEVKLTAGASCFVQSQKSPTCQPGFFHTFLWAPTCLRGHHGQYFLMMGESIYSSCSFDHLCPPFQQQQTAYPALMVSGVHKYVFHTFMTGFGFCG